MIDPITIAVNAGASLSVPESASIARKRKVPINKGKNKQRGSAKTPNASTWDRLKEYPNQQFAVVKGKLRCNACSEVLSDKKSSIERQTKSKKHEKGLADIERNKSEQQSIKECLQVNQRCLQIYNRIGMSVLSLLCQEEWRYQRGCYASLSRET